MTSSADLDVGFFTLFAKAFNRTRVKINFEIFAPKFILWVLTEAILMSTHKMCFIPK